jgi:hypothetical protein
MSPPLTITRTQTETYFIVNLLYLPQPAGRLAEHLAEMPLHGIIHFLRRDAQFSSGLAYIFSAPATSRRPEWQPIQTCASKIYHHKIIFDAIKRTYSVHF